MTLRELVAGVYRWAVTERSWILLVCLAVPVLGTVVARIGKAGRSDADGRIVASVVVGFAISTVVVEVLLAVCARSWLGASLLDADAVLLLSPLVGLALALVGIRWVFPLAEIASLRTALDLGGFVVACLVVAWFFGRFRGWGIVFVGGLGQLVVIVVLVTTLLARLYRRAFPTSDASS